MEQHPSQLYARATKHVTLILYPHIWGMVVRSKEAPNILINSVKKREEIRILCQGEPICKNDESWKPTSMNSFSFISFGLGRLDEAFMHVYILRAALYQPRVIHSVENQQCHSKWAVLLSVGAMISKLLKTGIYHTRWMNDVLEPITLKVVLVNLQCSKQFIGTYPTSYSTNSICR